VSEMRRSSGALDKLLRVTRIRREPILVTPDDPSPIAFCPFCGAVLDVNFKSASFCPSCGVRINQTAGTPPQGESKNSSKESQEALAKAIHLYTMDHWYVVRQKNDFAELRQPKRFNWTLAWATFAVGFPFPGLALVYPAVYATWHLSKKEKALFLHIDLSGSVQESTPPNQV